MKKLLKQILVLGIGGVLSLSSVIVGFASELSAPKEFYGTTHFGIELSGIYTPIPVLTLNWNPVSDAEGYEVWCRDTGGNDFYSDWYISQNVSITTAEEWIIDGNLQVKVRAYGNGGYSSYTDTITFIGSVGIADGPTSPSGTSNTGWVEDNSGWWYQRTDGSYPVNQWEMINGLWYHFNGSGYMQTGWINDGEKYYYLDSSGVMLTNCTTPDGYVLDSNGVWTDHISSSTNDMFDIYKDILYDNFPTKTIGDSRFALFDINKDGTKELLRLFGTGGAYSASYIYYYKDGEIIESERINGIEGYITAKNAVTTYSSHDSQTYQSMYTLENSGLVEIDSLASTYTVVNGLEWGDKYTHNNKNIIQKEYEKINEEYEKASLITFYEVSDENIKKYVK